MTSRRLLIPQAPKLLSQLDDWQGVVGIEVELEHCEVRGADLTRVERLEAEGCRLSGLRFAGAKLGKFQVADVIFNRTEAAGLQTAEAAMLRVAVTDSRLTGADFGEALLEDCVFENVKLDESGFRFATFKRVRFENCVLRNVDFTGVKMSNVSFSGCDLNGSNFDSAICKSVDLRGETLTSIKGVHGLKGATISSDQLIQLAPLLAAEAGFDVDYET